MGYQFRVIVSILSHWINFESLYQSYIKSKLTLYFFFRFFIHIETSIRNIIFISRKRIYLGFPLPLKRSTKKFFHILDLKNGLDIVYLLQTCKSKKKKKKENWKLIFFFIHIVYIVY